MFHADVIGMNQPDLAFIFFSIAFQCWLTLDLKDTRES